MEFLNATVLVFQLKFILPQYIIYFRLLHKTRKFEFKNNYHAAREIPLAIFVTIGIVLIIVYALYRTFWTLWLLIELNEYESCIKQLSDSFCTDRIYSGYGILSATKQVIPYQNIMF